MCVQQPIHIKGKLFDGWLHGAQQLDSNHVKKAARDMDGDNTDTDASAEAHEDQGGETWFEREHLAAPPAGWHRPKVPKKSKPDHPKLKLKPDEMPGYEQPGKFRGNGADASPFTIEQELEKGVQVFGPGKDVEISLDGRVTTTSIAQKLHKQHRTIRDQLSASDHSKPKVVPKHHTRGLVHGV